MTQCLFIFRRDLRIKDNTGLDYAMDNYDKVIPIFIFTPEQIDKNSFFSENSVQFMCESLKHVNKSLRKEGSKLHIFRGDNIDVLKKINKQKKIDAIIFNMDYTPYAKKRDKKIEKFGEENNIDVIKLEDYLLSNIGDLNKKDGTPYEIFTPFKNNALEKKVRKPNRKLIKNVVTSNLKTNKMISYVENSNLSVNGGRKNGLKILKGLKKYNEYDKKRNCLDYNTTRLSAYIKYGCVSIREVYYKIKKTFGKKDGLMAQIYWREFYFYIAYYYPEVLEGKNFNKKYDNIKWETNKTNYKKWAQGKTGYPVVDAGMNELNTTGYMHNRARLITSNFLNRLLGYHWTLGEKYFARQLVDYDPSVNNGNWQWIASTGVDPKPYFQRLFNPIIQSEKFDPDAEYIKKWCPELKEIKPSHLHNWEKYYKLYDLKDYPDPIVEYKKAREKSVKMYRKVLKKK